MVAVVPGSDASLKMGPRLRGDDGVGGVVVVRHGELSNVITQVIHDFTCVDRLSREQGLHLLEIAFQV